jgi:glycosyltransferase involved in cell wall biosynthesis
MEAMAASLPIVSTPVAGVPEMVEEGEGGFLVPERNAGALAGALGKLLSSREAMERFGKCGRKLAGGRFAVSVTARQLKALLLRKGRARLRAAAAMKDPGALAAWSRRWCRC